MIPKENKRPGQKTARFVTHPAISRQNDGQPNKKEVLRGANGRTRTYDLSIISGVL